MNNTKITAIFYVFLGISFFSVIFYVDSTFDRSSLPDILPSTLSSIETVEFVSLDRDEIYFLLTDVKNYPLVLPKNILSVEIINKTQNTIIAKEEIFERGITTTLLVKHIMSPPFNHTIQIIDGPAKGTVMNQLFEDNNPGTKITNNLEFEFEGILTPLKFLPKQNAAHAIGTIISSFETYGKISGNYNHKIIDDLYREILLRPADPEGLQHFGSLLESGKITEDEIRAQLLNSDERKLYEKSILKQKIRLQYNNTIPFIEKFNQLTADEILSETKLSLDTKNELISFYDDQFSRLPESFELQYFGSLIESEFISIDDMFLLF